MRLYRIYTEDKNRKRINKEISKYFDGFNLYKTVGFWKGSEEKSLIIEVVGFEREEKNIDLIRETIKKFNKQESVLKTVHAVRVEF